MRIVHYNILEGCRDEPERLARVHGWVARQKADVAGLAELNGWELSPGMAAHAEACGFPYSHLVVGRSEYRLGLMAREPIEVIEQITEGVHHGILHARIGEVQFVYSHFSPHERLMRIHEAQRCAEIVKGASEPLVLMGDLNSHSPRDRGLCETFATEENRAWTMDFEPQQILLDAGLMDVVGQDGLGTLNTAYHKTGGKRRLDYIYVNGAFKTRYPAVKAKVHRTAEGADASDHFPVVCDTES